MMKKTLFALITLVFCASISFSQGISTKETVEYINEKFPAVFQIKVDKDREMFIDFYKSGEIYRTDRVYLPTLEAKKTKYNTEEKSLGLYCLSDMPREFKKFRDGCIERTFHNKGIRNQYSRINLPIGNDEKMIKSLTKAFNHLILTSTDEGDYMGLDSFE